MNKNPLEVIAKNDKELFENFNQTRELAMKDGALPLKVKLLIALAIDASIGAEGGVRTLATQALNSGATKEEIMEAVRVAGFISGGHSLFTAAFGLDGVI